ncbi:ribosomal L1 domain-containing protein 1 [Senna tora]|uniref:Ribosomal L1 domain-containing protein 1 n=1 Tax=Senna tora TaxID=362788 RepID=A0A835CG71_9FABA|nr:ribosomal L1 domain-containing protein 1 [Senna tora]
MVWNSPSSNGNSTQDSRRRILLANDHDRCRAVFGWARNWNPTATSFIAVERLSPTTVQQAVNALLKWRNSKSQIEKTKLFNQDDEFIYLILTIRKIPSKARVKPHKVLLPNSFAYEFSENLLIIDDGPKSNLTKEDVQKKIKANVIVVNVVAAINGIVEVVPKKWGNARSSGGNVRSFHLKLFDSPALPLY